ncbi:hypothetical protein [Paenibacillus sinopodophylli]|uniref:hypothetical protein n=1 Tax=Paenibacillus sinopodophylli TaxID=1837342 RepID=UPI00110CA20C|nr:hypothetical protein [Paenibacillus sinopodophylli]
MSMEEYPVSNCNVCSQGWILIVEEQKTSTCFLYCNECETEWDNPIEFFAGKEGTKNKYGVVREATDWHIKDIGWDKYINNDLKNRLTP